MAFNGSGLFQINTAGQPVVAGTSATATAFNTLTADLATGLSTCITKDGQTTVTANIPMSTYKITGLGLGTDTTDAARVDNANALNMVEGRLTLTSGTAVTTADVTAAETIYFCPYKGNRIALYNGSAWVMRTFTELSLDVPDVTGVHDVFAYDNAGTVTLEALVWTNETTRATALTTQNGVLVKTGATTRRYLGTFYSTTAGNGQVEDSVANRYLWNYYNQMPRRMLKAISSTGYAYTSTIRQAAGSATNQVNMVIGVSESPVAVQIAGTVRNSSAGVQVYAYVGVDSVASADTTNALPLGSGGVTLVAGSMQHIGSSYEGLPGIGKHYIAWLESSTATGTTTWNELADCKMLGTIMG